MSNDTPRRRALLLVMSAPSGAGKTTLCNRLRAAHPEYGYSISCTTRAPRGAEVNGVHYHFLTEEEFVCRIAAGDFLEHANVHGRRYGTLRQPVVDALMRGVTIMMDIDVAGAAQIRARAREAAPGDPIREAFVDIFIEPPSMDALRARLTARAEDPSEEIDKRLQNAAGEMEHRYAYAHRVINDNVDRAYAGLERILEAESVGLSR